MLGVNKIILLGWVGQDPELRYTAAQRPVVQIRLATKRINYDADGEKQNFTDWHNVVFNDKLAEFCSHKLAKGTKLYIEGVLEYRSRQHSEFKAAKWEEAIVVASQIQIIDGMVIETYPDDFPELAALNRNKKK